jgi:hypothetical protein
MNVSEARGGVLNQLAAGQPMSKKSIFRVSHRDCRLGRV